MNALRRDHARAGVGRDRPPCPQTQASTRRRRRAHRAAPVGRVQRPEGRAAAGPGRAVHQGPHQRLGRGARGRPAHARQPDAQRHRGGRHLGQRPGRPHQLGRRPRVQHADQGCLAVRDDRGQPDRAGRRPLAADLRARHVRRPDGGRHQVEGRLAREAGPRARVRPERPAAAVEEARRRVAEPACSALRRGPRGRRRPLGYDAVPRLRHAARRRARERLHRPRRRLRRGLRVRATPTAGGAPRSCATSRSG